MDIVYFWVGLLTLFLNKIRYSLLGYRRARNFSAKDFKKAIEYDQRVVSNWKKYLKEYAGEDSFSGKKILELGPGEDLGTGLIMLADGAVDYRALDANNLVSGTSRAFYDKLIETIGEQKDFLLEELEKTIKGRGDKLHYIVNKDFDPGIFSDIDLIFSQAAFEHFDDLGKVARGLYRAAKKGAVLISEIDLKTHTGFLSEKDPLNIYRYSKFVYDFFHFSGIPNRLRPVDYVKIFSNNGWKDVSIYPLRKMDKVTFSRIKNSLNARFKEPEQQMQYLSIILCAKK